MAQEELVASVQTQLNTLKGNPHWSKALQLDGSPASQQNLPPDAGQPGAPTPEPSVTTISNTVAAAPPQPPVPNTSIPADRDEARLQRAVEAIRKARSM